MSNTNDTAGNGANDTAGANGNTGSSSGANSTSSRYFTEVLVDGFRGHRLRVPLGPVTLLGGPNGIGKTTARDALALCVSQSLPGRPTDSKGMVTTDVLGDCTPAGNKFRVEARDNAGATIGFAYTQGPQRGQRDVFSSLAVEARNEVHQAAIGARYGANVPGMGLISLDLDALRSADPGVLEKAVLRLCGAQASDWTPARVVRELIARTRDAVSSDVLEALGFESADEQAEQLMECTVGKDKDVRVLNTITDVREMLKALATLFDTYRHDWDSAVRDLTKTTTLPIPLSLSEGEIIRLRQDRDKAKAQCLQASEELGARRQRLDEFTRRVAEDREKHEREVKLGTTERDKRRRLLDEHIRAIAGSPDGSKFAQALADARSKAAELGVRIETERSHRPDLDAPVILSGEVVSRRAETRKLLEQAQALPIPTPPQTAEVSDEAMLHAKAQRVDAERMRDEAVQLAARAEARRGELLARRERYADGYCPECGQPADTTLSDIASEIADAEHSACKASEQLDAAKTLIEQAQATIDAVRTAKENYQAACRERADAIQKATHDNLTAEAAFTTAEMAARKAVTQAFQQWEQRVAQLEAEQKAATKLAEETDHQIASLAQSRSEATRRTQELQEMADAAEAALQEVLARVQAASAATAVPQEITDAIVQADEESTQANAALDAAEQAYEEANAAWLQAEDVTRRRDEAEERRRLAQHRHRFYREAINGLWRLEREVLSSFVQPLVEPVNELVEGGNLQTALGVFEADFGAGFRLGFRREQGFAPLSQLSEGHFALAMSMIVTAIHMLAGTAYRGVAIDGAEVVDLDTRPTLVEMLVWLQQAGHLDQVTLNAVATHRDEFERWQQCSPSLLVVDLRECLLPVVEGESAPKQRAARAA